MNCRNCHLPNSRTSFGEESNFITGLKRLHKHGKVKLDGEWSFLQSKAAFDDWLKPMEEQTWVAYIEPPPNETCPPELVAKYLARYLTGGPISDRTPQRDASILRSSSGVF